MKTRVLLLGVVFLCMTLVGRAQITQMYNQSFEVGEASNYTITPSAGETFSTVVYTSGARSLKLEQQTDQNVEFILDTLDFTQNTSLRYIALTFDHIVTLPKNSQDGDIQIATIYYKLAHQTDAQWKKTATSEYDVTGDTYSTGFGSIQCFNENSYNAWRNFDSIDDSQWRSERFNFNNVITPQIPVEQRKLLIKFVLKKRYASMSYNSAKNGWWIDNLQVKASAQPMVTPRISMFAYPDATQLPNSRGARITLDATTSVTQGIDPDSVYIYYTVGSDTTKHQVFMTPVTGTANRYTAYLPFEGYDTLMRFRCEVRDATDNANSVSFPKAPDAWIDYYHVRGWQRLFNTPPQVHTVATGSIDGESLYPFPPYADMKAEILYDSASLASYGYGPGAITSFKYLVKSGSNTAINEQRLQIKMKNVPTNFTHDESASTWYFNADYMTTVYDDVYTLPAVSAGDTFEVQLQDTFYYAGRDILMLMTIDNTGWDPPSTVVYMERPPVGKKTAETYNLTDDNNVNMFAPGAQAALYTSSLTNDRPITLFNALSNMPLLYDAGISALVDPNYNLAMVDRPGSIKVNLKNYGAQPLNAVRVSYTIDDTIFGYYDWSGLLMADSETEITIANNNINIPAGFHYLRVWVEDTVTCGTNLYRDHEPMNDTMFTEFIVCDGPMNGVRNIGGEDADFNDIDEFLFALARCGVDDSLIVRVAPGSYPPFTVPNAPGLSEENYLVFEAMDSVHPVVFVDTNYSAVSAVQLGYVGNVRFRHFDFERRNGALYSLVQLSDNCVNCMFEKCRFIDSLDNPDASLRISALLSTNMAEHLTVDSCTFIGGRIGISVAGNSTDTPSEDVVLRRNVFRNQYESAVRVENMTDVVVDSNQMYDVYSNATAVLQVNTTGGNTRLTSNAIYTSHGASALALSEVNGTATQHIVVANNMLVGNDDGTAGMMRTLLNVAKGEYIDVVYNSLKLTAPTRGNVATATFGGSGISHSLFANNIVASMDKVNYALNYQPGVDTSNHVLHNVYYSRATVLNRRGGTNCFTLAAWEITEPADTLSVMDDPVYLNATTVDLRTFKRALMGMGMPVATVDADMFGNQRDPETPCPGAFEFAALPFDFSPFALVSPAPDNCTMPELSELVVRILNDGVNDYTTATTPRLTLSWQVNGGSITSKQINDSIGSEDTITFATGSSYSMPANGIYDSVHVVRFWTSFTDDPNPTNDTVVFHVISRYHPAALAAVTQDVEYATEPTITLTEGIDSWTLYDNPNSPQVQSKVYWYVDSVSTEPIHEGATFEPGIIRQDTTFYVRQRRGLPVVRFTQLEVIKTATAGGLTDPLPTWLSDSRRMALEITNVGDAAVSLEGDSLILVSTTNAINNKIYSFDNITLQPAQSIVLQFAPLAESDSSVTLFTGISPATLTYSSNVGFIYKQGGEIVDALPLNSIITANSTQTVKWSTMNVPNYVWSGGGVAMQNGVAGIIRQGYAGKSSDWVASTGDAPMHLGTLDPDWLMYEDAGCEGDVSEVKLSVFGIPLVDLSVDEVILPEGGCYMENEPIQIRVSNYGVNVVDEFTVNYSAGGDVVSETVSMPLAMFEDTMYTFVQPYNFKFAQDSIVKIRAWVTHNSDDDHIDNDTNSAIVKSLFTPDAPTAIGDRSVDYGSSDTVVYPDTVGMIPVWYGSDMNPLDTGFVHISELIYHDATYGVGLLVVDTLHIEVGTESSVNDANSFPSPYQAYNKNIKQQYIYSAYDLQQAGVRAGEIRSLAFHLDTILGSASSVALNDYRMAVAFTADTAFAEKNDWKSASTEVFTSPTLTIQKSSSKQWIEHPFSTPIQWDGESSLVVQVSYTLSTAYTSGVRTYCSNKAGSSLYKGQNTSLSPSVAEFVGNGTIANKRPNIKVNAVSIGCNGPIATYNVATLNIPTIDAAIAWVDGEEELTYGSCDEITVSVDMYSQGLEDIDGLLLYYQLDDEEMDSVLYTDVYAAGTSANLTLFTRQLKPGVHSLKTYVVAEGDDIHSNDTLTRTLIVRFCAGEYTIGESDEYDYHSFGEAIDLLEEVGVLGTVTFQVADGEYEEQVAMGEIYGLSADNTLTFEGTGDSATLIYYPTSDANYVVHLTEASHIRLSSLNIRSQRSAANSTHGHVLVIEGGEDIHVENCYLESDELVQNANASVVILKGTLKDLYFANNEFKNGYLGLYTTGENTSVNSVQIEDNSFSQFANVGILLRNAQRVVVNHNALRSTLAADNRSLTGITLAQITDTLRVTKNSIYLLDNTKGGKRGIQLANVTGTVINPAVVSNNMISTHSANSQGLVPAKSAGIWIDTATTYVNVYFNTVSIYATAGTNATANDASYALHTGASTNHIEVVSNILHNGSYGYAYHMLGSSNVVSSDYNAYYTQAASPFYMVSSNYNSLTALQAANSDDAHSIFEEPYFVADTNLHLTMAAFAGKAQYNPDVPDDIDGNLRGQTPPPTIGAQEMERIAHDLSIIKVIAPYIPTNVNASPNIETDSLAVIVSFYNNGISTETNAYWYAYLEDYPTQTRSANKYFANFLPLTSRQDTVKLPMTYGIVDTQTVRIVVVCPEDTVADNNEASEKVFIRPAFNIAAKVVRTGEGCGLKNATIQMQVKNEGLKPIPAGAQIKIGYGASVTSPANYTVSTMPSKVEQTVTLTSALNVNDTAGFTFTQKANLYPSDSAVNLKVRIRGWAKYQYDLASANDTTSNSTANSPIKNSYYIPDTPIGHDTTLAYGTWGNIMAEQGNHLPIRWYRDTNAAPFYSPSSYEASTLWPNSPQYFHDSTYYLRSISAVGCSSAVAELKIKVNAIMQRDMACEAVLAPFGNRVYMENDTVKVRVANYGVTSQSNVPVVYELRRGQQLIQKVTEQIPGTIASSQTLEYTFNTLLDIPTPTAAQTYTLRAYTNLTNDGARANDTVHTIHTFASLAQERYNTHNWNPASSETKFDVTRFSFNGIDLEMPIFDRSYTNMADYDHPEYPVLHVTRGITDSVLIEITPLAYNTQRFRARATVDIDLNRDGLFSTDTNAACAERLIADAPFWSDSIFRSEISIPSCASLGYMRMRVKVSGYDAESTEGQLLDFLLFVDAEAPTTDLAIQQIVAPRDFRIEGTAPIEVSFRMANRGTTPITAADIYYKYIDDNYDLINSQVDTIIDDVTGDTTYYSDTTDYGVYHWTGNLNAGSSTVVKLPARDFIVGTTRLYIWHTLEGDQVSSNDTLFREYHRFHEIEAIFNDDFDNMDLWYAPVGYNEFSRNYWERATPDKTYIKGANSAPNAWVTDAKKPINSGVRGNVSYLYSPMIDNTAIRTDTVAFYLLRNLTGGSEVYLEFLNSKMQWQKFIGDSNATWYTDEELQAFTGSSAIPTDYTRYISSSGAVRGDLRQGLQFRMVYTTPIGDNTASNFGDGCAVDNFHIGRSRALKDIGVTGIVHPAAPRFGRTYNPIVEVENFGTDTVTSFQVGYTHYGAGLPKMSSVTCLLPPGEKQEFTLSSSFEVTSDYPDSFYLAAYTVLTGDLYNDNDSCRRLLYISPLNGDISAEELVQPMPKVVVGDTVVPVTLRLRNFGINDISTATASYTVNGGTPVVEEINFESLLGHPLASMEYFNYTFKKKIHATMGTMDIYAYLDCPGNEYQHNDTVFKRIHGIMAITDIAANAIYIDEPKIGEYHVAVEIENRGSRGVNNFVVGYWVNDNPNTMITEDFIRATPLPALSKGYYIFNYFTLQRPEKIRAVVYIDGDNDRSNDTTDVIGTPYIDLAAKRVLVEENSANDCRVFLEVRNEGSIPLDNMGVTISATVNGNTIMTTVNRRLDPGKDYKLEFNRKIPKSLVRQYVGSGSIEPVEGDTNQANDQTSVVQVVNYVEGIPTVESDGLILEQNYPNPFASRTVIPFYLPEAAKVHFFIMDAMGHILHRSEGFYAEGSHTMQIDMSAYPAGVYYYGIEVNGRRLMRKMILK